MLIRLLKDLKDRITFIPTSQQKKLLFFGYHYLSTKQPCFQKPLIAPKANRQGNQNSKHNSLLMFSPAQRRAHTERITFKMIIDKLRLIKHNFGKLHLNLLSFNEEKPKLEHVYKTAGKKAREHLNIFVHMYKWLQMIDKIQDGFFLFPAISQMKREKNRR